MLTPKSGLIYIGLLLMTIMYCWLIWLGMGGYGVWVSELLIRGNRLPLITKLTAYHSLPYPYHAMPWQILAFLSLILNFIWGWARSKELSSQDGHTLPTTCHVGWVTMSLCVHGVGMLSPIFSVAAVLSQ